MIFYPKFSYASPPRTATTWFIHACDAVGLGPGNKSKVHFPSLKNRTEFVLCTVRHPCHWLRSYYDNIMDGVIGVPQVDLFAFLYSQTVNSKNFGFEDFVKSYLRQCPGSVGKMFDSYRASSCMRVEDLPWALITFLESPSVGIKDASKIKNIPRQNARKITPPEMDDYLFDSVMRAERDFCERYDYY